MITFDKKTEQDQLIDLLHQTSRTLQPTLQQQLKNKYCTFTRFNYREAYRNSKRVKSKKQQIKGLDNELSITLQKFIFGEIMGNKQKKKDKKKQIVIEELAGVKSERRERFKKAGNIFQIIKHYVEKQNFKAKSEELYLMRQLSQIKEMSQQNNLDILLKKLYKIMNETVDLNELRFLSLLVMLTGQVCFQFKDFTRAFYFYNQAKRLASYTDLFYTKAQALMAMGNIALQMKLYNEAIRIYKKALQYSWRIKNTQQQLLIYDMIGNCYYYQGNSRESAYYHKRFTQGQYEHADSAIKKISQEMLGEYEKHLHSLEKKNITSLLLQYINIPIVNPKTFGLAQEAKKTYENYGELGESPRKKKGDRILEFQDFTDVIKQIYRLLDQDYEFRTQIPNPDVQINFYPTQSFGKNRKDIAFEQTTQFHKIMGHSDYRIDLSKLHSNSLQKRVEAALSARQNNDWWDRMRDKIRKNQLQNVGRLRDRVFNSHQSYNKYPEERRRSYSFKNEKIKQSFNKTILDWIDPPK